MNSPEDYKIRTGTQREVYKVAALPTLLYGSEYWTITAGDRIVSVLMRYLKTS
jgi:hypothetical protein